MKIVCDWFNVTKLSLNTSKTHFVFFHPYQYRCNKTFDIVIDNVSIVQKQCVKFLGLYLDSHLNWKDHINVICGRVCKAVGVLYKIKNIVPRSVLITLYYSLIYSQLSYCNIVWGNASSHCINKLYVMQKKAVRIITNSNFLAHASPLFSSLHFLKVHDIYKYQVGCFMYKYLNQLLPDIPRTCFSLNSNVHPYPTRTSSFIHIPKPNTLSYSKSLLFTGATLWNSLPYTLKVCTSINKFSKCFKDHLLNSARN